MRRCVGGFVLVFLLVIVIEVWPQLTNDEFRMSNDDGLRMVCSFFGRGRHSCARRFLACRGLPALPSLGHEL
jgi:hypothetical protein